MSGSLENKPNQKAQFRRFGWSLGLLLGVMFGGLLPFLLNLGYSLWPWALTLGLIAVAEIAPLKLSGAHKYWFKFAELAHNIFNPILLGIIFFGLILPLGRTKRALGKSKIKLKLDPQVASYREPMSVSVDLRDPF